MEHTKGTLWGISIPPLFSLPPTSSSNFQCWHTPLHTPRRKKLPTQSKQVAEKEACLLGQLCCEPLPRLGQKGQERAWPGTPRELPSCKQEPIIATNQCSHESTSSWRLGGGVRESFPSLLSSAQSPLVFRGEDIEKLQDGKNCAHVLNTLHQASGRICCVLEDQGT